MLLAFQRKQKQKIIKMFLYIFFLRSNRGCLIRTLENHSPDMIA